MYYLSYVRRSRKERRAIAEHISCGNTQPLLIKLDKSVLFFIRSGSMLPQ